MKTNGVKLERLARVLGPLLVVGCADLPPLGAVVQHNIVAQVVDMDPQHADVPIEGGNGQRSADAIKRYNNGSVRPLEGVPGGGNAPK
jgi:hypothetical protein